MSENKKVENVMRDTRKDVRYVILASRKLTREEMLQIIRLYNYQPMNIKVKSGNTVTIESEL